MWLQQTVCGHCFLANCPEWEHKVLVVDKDLKCWKNGAVLIGLSSRNCPIGKAKKVVNNFSSTIKKKNKDGRPIIQYLSRKHHERKRIAKFIE